MQDSSDVEHTRVGVVERNIEALLARRRSQERALGWQDRLAGAVGSFAGSIVFIWLHVVLFGGWIVVNSGLVPGIEAFDPSFGIVAMMASVEAIFLSTFILIAQNRMQAQAERRAELHLQISLLAEHELTRVMQMTATIAERVGAEAAHHDVSELARDVRPEQVLDSIERRDKR